MKNITRWSLALIMFSLFLVSYLVTSVSAQNTDCMQHPAGSTARDNCQENNNAAPGSAAAGNTTSSGGISNWIKGGLKALGIGAGSEGNNCMQHPVGSAARDNCQENNNAAPGSAAAGHMNSGGNDCMQHPAGSAARDNCQENNNAAPGSAAAGHMNSGGNDCSDHPAGSVARTSCENP
jgi:hypothetical protein